MPVKSYVGVRSTIAKLALKLIPVKKGLVFLTLHNLESSEYGWLCNVLDYLQHSCDFIDIKDIENTEQFSTKGTRSKIILTFDDAFKCHKTIATECLEPRNIKALFFVPTGFVGLSGNTAFEFARVNFFPKRKPDELNLNDYDAMTWDDLDSLIARGHTVGGHTKNHPDLSQAPQRVLEQEIVDSADILEDKLQVKINHFAYPFGSVESISKSSFVLAKKRFKFAYSNVRGLYEKSPSKHFIFRQNIVPRSPIWLIKAIVEGRLDIVYRKQIALACRNYQSN